MPRKNANVSLTSYDDIFGPEETYERVQEIPLEELHPFKNHPFKVIDINYNFVMNALKCNRRNYAGDIALIWFNHFF